MKASIKVISLLWATSVIFQLSYSAAFGQQTPPNLVPNGGFEQHTWCPVSGSSLNPCESWSNEHGSVDYYHMCGFNGGGIPLNMFGVQDSYDSAYLGLLSYGTFFPGAQELAGSGLIQPLEAGVKYRVKMKVSFADRANYAVCCVGVRLSSMPPPSPPFFQNWSSVELIIDNADFDTTTWFHLDELYTAQGGEDKIYLGTFRPEADLNPLIVGDTSNTNYNSAYFYIDDVEVYEDNLVSLESNSLTEFEIGSQAGNMLSVEVSLPMTLNLLDLSGRFLHTQRLTLGSNTIDVTSIPAGLYVATVNDKAGKIVGRQKVIIAR